MAISIIILLVTIQQIPTDPRSQKAGQHGEKIIEGIALSDNLGGSNYSRDSVVTEEIPMTFMHGEDGSPSGYQKQETWMTSPKETQDLLQSPQFQQAQTFGRGPSTNITATLWKEREHL
ncbi:phospholipid transporting ATPase [Fusarium oxysporum]|nr:phospholipid transporting ATPase [Fusarium oxysporum]